MFRTGKRVIAGAIAMLISLDNSAMANVLTFSTTGIAIQKVELFPGLPFQIDATLTGVGSLAWNLDVDANGNTINSDSSVFADFVGTLPAEFAVLGLAGASFDLHSLPSDQSVTTTNNGTVLTVNSKFEIDVPAAGAVFYTVTPSEFITAIAGVPFTTFHFTSPDVTGVYIGDNPLGILAGSLVGASFDRTVSSVPEPSTAILLVFGSIGALVSQWRRRH
jgi:hypothetical protein